MEWIQSAALLIFFSDRLQLKDTVFFLSRPARDPSWRGEEGREGGREGQRKTVRSFSLLRHDKRDASLRIKSHLSLCNGRLFGLLHKASSSQSVIVFPGH